MGSIPGWEDCIVFLGETLHPNNASVSTQAYKVGTGKFNAGGNHAMD